MKTTQRFENAVKLLYIAFHNNTLDAFNCQNCAVGTLVKHSNWHMHSITGDFSSLIFTTDAFFLYPEPNNSDYSNSELLMIEAEFLSAWLNPKCNDFSRGKIGYHKEFQFKGLCNVVEFLAKLDNIPNPFDYIKLFETIDDKPKYQLELIEN